MAQTTFAGKKNPFTGQPLKPVRRIDADALKISADPVVEGRARVVSKFDALFSQLKPGQCLICEPAPPRSTCAECAKAGGKHD